MFDVRSADDNSTESLAKAITRDKAVVLSAEANRRLFNNTSGTGKIIYAEKDSSEIYITGVIHEIKKHKYGQPEAYIFFPFNEAEFLKGNEQYI